MKQTAAFVTAAQTRNQLGVASALDSLPQTGAALGLYNTLLAYDSATARNAFNQLSGEVHAASRAVLLYDNYGRGHPPASWQRAADGAWRACFGMAGG